MKTNDVVEADFTREDLNEAFFDAGFKPGPTTPILANSMTI